MTPTTGRSGSTHDPLDGASPDDIAAFLESLTVTDDPIADEDLPPRLEPGEEVLVPRSVKLPMWLDAAVGRLADRAGLAKSEFIRQVLSEVAQREQALEVQDELAAAEVALARATAAVAALRRHPPAA